MTRSVVLLRTAVLIGVASLGWSAASASQPASPAPTQAPSHDHEAEDVAPPPSQHPGIPAISETDRAAAFPDVEGHTVHDNAVNYFVLFDQFEWQAGNGTGGASWDNYGWIGLDRDRFWFRTEGAGEDGHLGDAEAHVLYGRAFARWWDFVVGVRQDFEPGPAQSWAAVGIQGLAPYWFEVELTGYVGQGGQTAFRAEVEYELLLTNRLILQPLIEVNLHGKTNPERGIGAGLTTAEAGVRLRYEIRRELAPYVGINWARTFGKTADFVKAEEDEVRSPQFLVGLRFWF